jgi:hypothetical protein
MSARYGAQARIYRLLLAAYPHQFRARFEDDMVQLFVDQLRAANAGPGGDGTARTWLRAIGDLAVSAPSERARSGRTVGHTLGAAPSPSTRLLGLLGILGGLLLVAAFVPNLPWTSELFNLRLVVFNVGAIAVAVAIHRRIPAASRQRSLGVLLPLVVANSWYLTMVIVSLGRPQFPDPDPEFRLIMFSAGLAMWLSDAAFGLVTWRLRSATPWGAAALAAGSVLALLGMDRFELVRGDLASLFVPLALIGIALNGTGWILLGIDTALGRRRAGPSARVTPG